MKLIVGLGNPEDKQSLPFASAKRKYAGTRHNLGFKVLDELIKKLDGGRWKIGVEDGSLSRAMSRDWKMEEKFKAELIKTPQLILVKPLTFVNHSGMAVKLLTTYYKIPTTDVIIIHDDLDLPLGKIKVRLGGAAAGHHGVESIISELGTDKFIRVRLGIGNLKTLSGEHKRISFNAEHFVLEPFMHSEKAQVKHMIKQAIKAIEILLEKGLETAQNQFN